MDLLRLDVLVIGAGQAGLAAGHAIQQANPSIRFLLVDSNGRPGDSWRRRYDSLVLFTPRAYSALPGLPVPGDPVGFPSKDEIADYLAGYAKYFMLPIRPLTSIRRLDKTREGFHAVTEDGLQIESRAVILANGAFQKPAIPALAAQFAPEIPQLNAMTYHSPADLPPGPALVVGDGATGRQIALEIAARQAVTLAGSGRIRPQPQRILGRDYFWWADHLGLLDAPVTSPIGSYLQRGDTFPGQHLGLEKLRGQGVQVAKRLAAVDGYTACFQDGAEARVSSVVWATGYKEDDGFVNIPYVKKKHGGVAHYRGVTPAPGLFVLGRDWQWTRGSALLHGVGKDAAFIVGVLNEFLAENYRRLTRLAAEA